VSAARAGGRPCGRVTTLAARFAVAAAVLLNACVTTAPAPPATTPDGLVRRSIRGVELAYVRPEADSGRYTRILLDSVYVEFDEAWSPAGTGESAQVAAAERERVRRETATLLERAFRQSGA
jgi:hypothetical protein